MVPLADEKGEEAAVVDGVQDARREQVGSESRRDARDGVGREFGGVDRALPGLVKGAESEYVRFEDWALYISCLAGSTAHGFPGWYIKVIEMIILTRTESLCVL